MSRFFSGKYAALTPYTPGEQPRERTYVKLNTNESPFPPSALAQEKAAEAAKNVQLYCDPTCKALAETAAEVYGVDKDEILFTNGSDDILNFAFMAFCDKGAVFPDITYGFYPVFAKLNNIAYREIPLKADFTVDVADYLTGDETVFIANPNAPTGICLPLCDIERIVAANPNRVVVVDEAYVDFGGESAVSLIHKYENLLVTQTFSKSRSMAGARLGMGFGCKALIKDLNTIKYSTNPYNINSMTMAAGIGALQDKAYFLENCEKIQENRAYTKQELERLGFTVLPSKANFLFARHETYPGEKLYRQLKEKGILVRHFSSPRLDDYNRITIGSKTQMQTLIETLEEIL